MNRRARDAARGSGHPPGRPCRAAAGPGWTSDESSSRSWRRHAAARGKGRPRGRRPGCGGAAAARLVERRPTESRRTLCSCRPSRRRATLPRRCSRRPARTRAPRRPRRNTVSAARGASRTPARRRSRRDARAEQAAGRPGARFAASRSRSRVSRSSPSGSRRTTRRSPPGSPPSATRSRCSRRCSPGCESHSNTPRAGRCEGPPRASRARATATCSATSSAFSARPPPRTGERGSFATHAAACARGRVERETCRSAPSRHWGRRRGATALERDRAYGVPESGRATFLTAGLDVLRVECSAPPGRFAELDRVAFRPFMQSVRTLEG